MFFRILVMFIFSCGIIHAQEPIEFSTKQGFPSNNVYDLTQDLDGNMWFATNRGIVKYNGSELKIFTIKDGLPNNDIWGLEVDDENRIWFFSKSNVQGYIKGDEVFKFATENNQVLNPSVIHTDGKELWMQNKEYVYSFEGNMIKMVINNDSLNYSAFNLDKSDWRKLLFIPETEHIIVLHENKIIIANKNNEILTSIKLGSRSFKILTHGGIRNQKVFIVLSDGLIFIDLKSFDIKQISFKDLIEIDHISYAFVKSLKSEIQLSLPGQLLIFNENFEIIERYNFLDEKGMAKKYCDINGNIWKTDLSKGVELFTAPAFETKYDLVGKQTQKINKIDSTLFVGVKDDYFYQFDLNSQIFKKCPKLKSISDVYEIKSNDLTRDKYFVSSNSSYKIDLVDTSFLGIDTKYFGHFNGKDYLLSSSQLASSPNGIKLIKYGLTQLEIFSNKLYIAGSDGLFILQKDSMARTNKHNSILESPINSLAAMDNDLLIGTDGRGVLLHNEHETVQIKSTDGLIIQRVLKRNNELWLATQEGVKVVELDSTNLEESKIVNAFYETDGLLQNNVNDIFIDKDDLYVLSDIGLAKISPSDSVYLNKPKLKFNTKSDTLEILDSKDGLNVSFSTIDYVNQENFTYQYRLLPNQKSWRNTPVTLLNFNNLSPRLYTLEVKVEDQHQNFTIKKLYINIIPHWWQTLIFKILSFFLGFLLLIGILYAINHRIRKYEIKKTRKEKRLIALELQALRSQMNPHFVHNSLNAILYYIQRNENFLSEKYLLKISKLVRTYYNYSKKRKIKIKDEIDLLKNYLDIEKLRFEEKLEYRINIDENLNIETLEIPSMLLQPIVENAINHGIFHKNEGGLVQINFNKIEEDKLEIIIEDNGVGIERSNFYRAEFSENHDARSSAILRERLALFKLSKEWNISMEISDLSQQSKRTGTSVKLLFDFGFKI